MKSFILFPTKRLSYLKFLLVFKEVKILKNLIKVFETMFKDLFTLWHSFPLCFHFNQHLNLGINNSCRDQALEKYFAVKNNI